MTTDFDVIGPYRIVRILGQGGMGTVYHGVHSKTNDSVAIKVIAAAMAQHQRFRRRFDAEIQTLLKLKHPSIVQLLGFGEERGLLFYSMEYVDGENLQQLLRREKQLPWSQVLDFAIDISAALKHAHDSGIIHRDLKPANLMINTQGKIKLTDFGIAKLFGGDGATVEGAVLGTADFMAPEQAEGKPVSIRSDLYALGSVCYAALSGRSPFQGKNIPEVLFNVRYGTLTPLESLVPNAPKELCRIVMELLDRDPSRRPATGLVVGNRLQAMRVGLANLSREVPKAPDVRNAKELTSIDLEPDSSLLDIGAPSNKTKIMTSRIDLDDHPQLPANGDTQYSARSMAGPEEKTRIQMSESGVDADGRPSGIDFMGNTNFTEVQDEHRHRSVLVPPTTSQHNDWGQRISIAVLAIALVACVGSIYWLTRPPSANVLFQEVATAIETNEDEQWLAAEPAAIRFKELYPDDPRVSDIDATLDEIASIRSARQIQRKARREGADTLAPVEQAYLECIKFESVDSELAKSKLKAFLIVFGEESQSKSKQKQLVSQAKKTLDRLEKSAKVEANEAVTTLKAQMDWADANLAPEIRSKWLRAVVELFEDKPWARELIQRAKTQIDTDTTKVRPL